MCMCSLFNCIFLVKLTEGRGKRKKSTVYMTSTGNLISQVKFKLVNKTSPVQPNLVWQSDQGEHSPEGNLTASELHFARCFQGHPA